MNKTRQNIMIFVLKVLITTVCLWWLSRYFDLQQIRAELAGINSFLVLLAIVLHFLAFLAGGVRWWLLFRHINGPIAFRHLWPSYYLGAFYNNVLPSAYGGDLARTARLYVAGFNGSALVGSALVDRMLGLAALIFMGGVALALVSLGPRVQIPLKAVVAGLLILAPAVLVALLPRWAQVLNSCYGKRWPKLQSVLACLSRYRTAPGLILKAFALSVLNQLLVVMVLLALAPKLGVNIPAVQLVVVLVLVFLVASLPISLGGLGPRESAMLGLLLPLGVESASVMAMSAVYLLALWGSTLPGAFMLLLREPKVTDSKGLSAS